MELRRLVVYTIANYLALVASLDTNLIIKYFKFKKIQAGTLYSCDQRKDQVNMGKLLMDNGLSLKLFDLSEFANYVANRSDLVMNINKHLVVVLDADCPQTEDFLAQANQLNVFTASQHWLVFLSNTSIDGLFSDLALTIDTNIFVAVPSRQDGFLLHWHIFEVYNPASEHGGHLVVKWYQLLQRGQTFRPRLYNFYWERRNMTGVKFRTMVVLPKPFPGKTLEEYLDSDEDRQVNSLYRFHTVLVYHMRDFYNFSTKMSKTHSLGFKMANGTFDGLVGALERREVDFGSSPLFAKEERVPALDYGRRTWILRSAFLFRIPKRPASMEVFLRPLDGKVWCVIVATMFLIVVVFKLAISAEFKYLRHLVFRQYEASWSFLALFTIGALCQQGAAIPPVTISSRIIFIFVFVFSILLYQFYSARIVSILLVAPAKFIVTLKDLAHSNLKLGCEDALYNLDYIKKFEHDPLVSLLTKKALHAHNLSFFMPAEVGLPLVAQGGFAYHVEDATAYPIIKKTFDEDVICSLDEIQLFRIQQMYQPSQKGSPFREMLNHVLQKMDENGLLKRQLSHWYTKRPACLRSRQTSSVSIEEFYPALSVLAFGILFSLLVLVVEVAVKLRQEKLEEERLKMRIKKTIRPYVN